MLLSFIGQLLDAFRGNFHYSAVFAIILIFLAFHKFKNVDDDDDFNWGFWGTFHDSY